MTEARPTACDIQPPALGELPGSINNERPKDIHQDIAAVESSSRQDTDSSGGNECTTDNSNGSEPGDDHGEKQRKSQSPQSPVSWRDDNEELEDDFTAANANYVDDDGPFGSTDNDSGGDSYSYSGREYDKNDGDAQVPSEQQQTQDLPHYGPSVPKSSIVMVIDIFEKLKETWDGRRKSMRASLNEVTELLAAKRSSDAAWTQQDVEKILEALEMVCETQSTTCTVLALDCIEKIVSYGYLDEFVAERAGSHDIETYTFGQSLGPRIIGM
ncbi:hypothetical protein EV182_002898, partial [Spiromyces aspiralis]